MTKHLFLNPIIFIIFVISCTGDIVLEKQVLKPSIPLNFGESRLIKKYGLTVEFKKMETDSFALIFLFSKNSTDMDSLPINIIEVILGISLQSREVDPKFRLKSTNNYTELSIRSEKSKIESIFHQAVNLIYNQSFDSALNMIDRLKLEDLQRYHSDKFVTTGMVCVIIGNFKLEYIENLIEKNFYDRTVGTGSIKEINYTLDNIYFINTGFDSSEVDSL